MYLYFNKEGVLKTCIPHGEPVRQNDFLDLYICLDAEFFSLTDREMLDWNVNIDITMANGQLGVTQIYTESIPELKMFHKENSSEITYDLIDGEYYWTYYFRFPPGQSTYYPGKIKISTSIIKIKNQKQDDLEFFGNADIFVEATLDKSKLPLNMTLNQYENLLTQINGINSNKANRGYVDEKISQLVTVSGFSVIPGVLTETEVTNLFNTKENGGYIVNTVAHGTEIVIIGKETNTFTRYAGGYNYVYNFGTSVWDALQNINLIVDDELSTESQNPINNAAVTNAINKIHNRLSNVADSLSYSSFRDFLDSVYISNNGTKTYISKIITENGDTIEKNNITIGTKIFIRGLGPDYWLAEKEINGVLLGNEDNIKLSFFEISGGGEDVTSITEDEIFDIIN